MIKKRKIGINVLIILNLLLSVVLIESVNWIIGLLWLMLSFAGYRAWILRDSLKLIIESTERVIFGKPLVKENWEKGEIKNLKVKMKWKK